MTLPVILGAVGFGAFITAGLINGHPATPSEMRRLADEHNTELRRRLSEAGALRASRVELAPYAGAGGGGLLLRGSF
jgi:hypothetical protein